MRSASIVSQLEALCRAEPIAPKVVFVPEKQIGGALETAVAQRIGASAGLTCTTPTQYASHLARMPVAASGRTALKPSGRSFLAADILADLNQTPEGAALQNLPSPHRFARTVGSAVNTLRLGSVVPASVRDRADADDASETLFAVAACYERYVEVIDERGLYDDADVLMGAIEQVERGAVSSVERTVYAVADATMLEECAYRFVHTLRQTGRRFVRLGAPSDDRAPVLSAAAWFPDAERHEDVRDAVPPASAGPDRFVRAVGAPNEVRAAVHDLLVDAAAESEADEKPGSEAPGGGERGLDEAELAYTDSRPYLSLIVDTLDRLDLPATIATGLRGTMTRTGRSLDGLYEWMGEGFDPQILIRLLRSGHLRVDRWMQRRVDSGEIAAEDALEAHEVASLLAEHRYEDGRHGYDKTLQYVLQDVEAEIETLRRRREDPSFSETEQTTLERALERTAAKRDRLRLARQLVHDLIALATGEDGDVSRGAWEASVEDVAARSQTFIKTFGPVDEPAEDADRSLAERARQMFLKELSDVGDLPLTHTASGTAVAALMREWMDHQFVPPQDPEPGAVHVVPLESAGYTGRSRLYVVGGDSDTLSTTAVDDAMLRDADRRALSASLEGTLPEQGSAADESLWRVTRALQRHGGATSLYTRIFDVDSGEERYPSSLFLRREAEAGDDRRVEHRTAGFLPSSDDTATLADTEAWLASYRARTEGDVAGATARERLAEAYPWILQGEAARRARASDRYTEHDGLLTPESEAALDFFAADHPQKMSAGRLETLAETPYVYFLRYVLGVTPLDEPALDDEPWMNRLTHGDILHQTFEAFMKKMDGAAPSPLDQEVLRKTLNEKVDRYAQRFAPPSTVVREAAVRRLWNDALVFLRAEADRAGTFEALHHELGFGFGPHRRQEGDRGDVTLRFADGHALRLRGRIDRVDRLVGEREGELAIWDYKTGSAGSYDEDEPLQDGTTLQWALYAYALDELQDAPVAQSGYFFTSTREMGTRLAFEPASYRERVEAIVTHLGDLARTGTFPMSPDAHRTNPWKYRGYDRLFPNLRDRTRDLEAKSFPSDRPVPVGWDD